MKYEEDLTIPITEYLQEKRNAGIRNILNILDMSHIDAKDKKKVRSAVLDEMNQYYIDVCKVLTCIQEKNAKDN